MGPALAAIAGGRLPVVAALNGAAIGGGCELAATCDLRVAHEAVTLTMPPVRLGLVYAPTGLARFVALCGLSRTRELFLTATPVPAARAREWGLVDHVVAARRARGDGDGAGDGNRQRRSARRRGHAPRARAAMPARRRRGAGRARRAMQQSVDQRRRRRSARRLPRKRKPAFKGR